MYISKMAALRVVSLLSFAYLVSAQYIPQQPLPGYNPYGNNGSNRKTTASTTQYVPPTTPTTRAPPVTTRAPPVTTRAPPVTYQPVNTPPSTRSCQYTFQVPDPKGACAGTSTALTQKLDQVKHDLDQTRFQYVAQNSMIQSTLAKIQSDTGNYISRVASLDSDLKKLQQLVNSKPAATVTVPVPTGGNSSANTQYLNQVIHDTKDLLTKAVSDINNKIFNVTTEMHKSALDEAKLQSELEKQITQQAGQIATAEQKLTNIENILKNLQTAGPTSKPSPTSGTTASPNGLINQLKNDISRLENDVKNADKTQQQEYKKLQDRTDKIMDQLKNQTTDINNLDSATRGALVRLQNAEKDVNDAKNNLTQLQRKIEPQIQIIAQEVSETSKNLTRMENELGQVGGKLLTNQVKSMQDRKEIQQLKSTAQTLTAKMGTLNSTISTQTLELAKLTADVQALSGSTGAPGSGSGSGNSVSKLVDQIKNKTEADIQKTQKDLAGLRQIVMTLLSQVTSLAKMAG